jgi:hypothetical protein
MIPRAEAAARPTRPFRLGLVFAAVAAAVVRLAFSRANPVNYDGYWHVFIARNLSREISTLAHPPLFPILLRQADAFRHSRFSYLSISLIAGVAAVVLFGRVLRKLCDDATVPVLGAVALALSPSAIALSGVVESYMLCLAFLLSALLAYVDLLVPEPSVPTAPRRCAFAAFTSLALLSHYAAGFFLLATALAPPVLAALEPRVRQDWKRALPRRLAADAATLLAPAIVAFTLYALLARPWVRRLSHVADFYLDPTRETVPAFLGRSLAATFNLFSPIRVDVQGLAVTALVLFVGAALVIAVASDRQSDRSAPGATPATLLLLILVLGMCAGLVGAYPFGGQFRHQFLAMVFGLLAAFVALDRVLAGRSSHARTAVAALTVAVIAANAWTHLDKRWRPRPEPFTAERDRFDRDFPGAAEVHVDQFNLIGFFAQHHDWTWEFLGSDAEVPLRQRYRVSRDGHSLVLVAHRDFWTMDPLDPRVYEALRASASAHGVPPATFYGVHQSLPGERLSTPPFLRDRIPLLARDAGLETSGLDVFNAGVFAQFRTMPKGPTP